MVMNRKFSFIKKCQRKGHRRNLKLFFQLNGTGNFRINGRKSKYLRSTFFYIYPSYIVQCTHKLINVQILNVIEWLNDPRRNTNTWWQQLILHFAEGKGTQLVAPTKTKTKIPVKRKKKQMSNLIYEKW